MGIIVFMYLICSIRINVVFFGIFLFLDIALFLLTGAYWKASAGDLVAFEKLEIVSWRVLSRVTTAANEVQATGAFVFALCILGFYLLFAQLLESVQFPLHLPVGDLSSRVGNRKRKSAEQET